MECPPELRYAPTHDWARREASGLVTMGITEYAEHELGELQYLALPRVGTHVRQGAPLGEVESAKTVSNLYAPVSGVVEAINDEAAKDPTVVNADPYGRGWLVRIAADDANELQSLLDADGYRRFLAEGEA